jgi:hypothetical protein
MHRPQEFHADLGLIDDDRTEDMRKAPAATEASREPTHQCSERTIR